MIKPMYCIRKITDDVTWIGANDRRLAMFEGVYHVPRGVAYNSYLLSDEKTVIFDTVDKAVRQRFLENLTAALGGRKPDYLVIQHMEPDHSAQAIELLTLYPGLKLVCNTKTLDFLKQFHEFDFDSRVTIVGEGDTLETGKHTLQFVMAPMVHWPEVMVTYDSRDKILFSADAFGCFGALNGALFADEVDFDKDYMDEARRYYANIVGKYGPQALALLGKASALEIDYLCPLHGFVWRRNIGDFIGKYLLWGSYTPEESGVMIAYASVYGNTENAAEILAHKLRARGVRSVMYDVSVSPASDIVSEAFRWSHLVFASTTYNAGIFVTMESVVNDLVSHNIQNRTVAVIENGSWAATSGGLIRENLEKCRNITFLDCGVSLRSSLKAEQAAQIETLAAAIAATFPAPEASVVAAPGFIDANTMFKLHYGLFVLTTKDGEKDNGCITNTAIQVSENPRRISIAVNKANYSCGTLMRTGVFNISILTESAPFSLFESFGFHSGRDTDKFSGYEGCHRTENGVRYLPEFANGVISGKVVECSDNGSHMLFTADVTTAFVLSGEPSLTYQYYFDHIKPKPKPRAERKAGYVCKICGYEYEGEPMPEDFICPLCKHGASDFEKITG